MFASCCGHWTSLCPSNQILFLWSTDDVRVSLFYLRSRDSKEWSAKHQSRWVSVMLRCRWVAQRCLWKLGFLCGWGSSWADLMDPWNHPLITGIRLLDALNLHRSAPCHDLATEVLDQISFPWLQHVCQLLETSISSSFSNKLCILKQLIKKKPF